MCVSLCLGNKCGGGGWREVITSNGNYTYLCLVYIGCSNENLGRHYNSYFTPTGRTIILYLLQKTLVLSSPPFLLSLSLSFCLTCLWRCLVSINRSRRIQTHKYHTQDVCDLTSPVPSHSHGFNCLLLQQ